MRSAASARCSTSISLADRRQRVLGIDAMPVGISAAAVTPAAAASAPATVAAHSSAKRVEQRRRSVGRDERSHKAACSSSSIASSI